jgi:hypothetical protein
MKLDLTKLATAGVLTMSAIAAAHAGSVTQPGETIGVVAGTPLAPGWYFVDTTDWGVRDTPAGKVTLGVTIPVIAWSSPWTFLGGRVQFLGAFPAVELGVVNTSDNFGMFNPFFAGQLAWDLGSGWGFSYALGTYIGVKNAVAFDSTSINQRFALSYIANGWNLTANAIWGIQPDQLTTTVNPDFINLDLTAVRKFGNWELGPVAFLSSDLTQPSPLFPKQSEFALGGIVGYNFGPVILQGYLTRDVAESNHGGLDTRVWGRVIIPVLDPPAAATPPAPLYRR